MTATTPGQHRPVVSSDQVSDFDRSVEAAIRSLEQQANNLEEAYYDALRAARDASRRAAELRLQVLEVRMRLSALLECEPINAGQHAGRMVPSAVLRMAHFYFDEPGKYRLVVCPIEKRLYQGSGETYVPAWYSKVVYDATRPESRCSITISDAVHAAYRAAEKQGYRLMWGIDDVEDISGHLSLA